MPTVRRPARAEVVGSLLRPPGLRRAIEAFYETGHSAVLSEEREKDRSDLVRLEDDAIREAVRRQIDLGLDVVSDGEFRRWMFMNSFYDAVEGVRTGKTVTFRNDRGERVELNVHEIADRLRPVASPAADEATFLSGVTGGHPFKVTFPAPSIFGHPLTTVAEAYRLARRVRRARDPDRASADRRRDRRGRPLCAARLPALSVPGRPRLDRTVRSAWPRPRRR